MALAESDASAVWSVLTAALSHDGTVRSKGEEQLQQLANRDGFCMCLLYGMQGFAADDSVRVLAAVQLKQVVSRKWSRAAVKDEQAFHIKEAEKAVVRNEILKFVGTPDAKVGIQIAVTISKIARTDYPAFWPDLFDALCAPLVTEGCSHLLSVRTWFTVHHVLKELSTKRLPPDQRRFQQLTTALMPSIWNTWATNAQYLTANIPQLASRPRRKNDDADPQLAIWLTTTKILKCLLASGFRKDIETVEPESWVMTMLPHMCQLVTVLVAGHPLLQTASQQQQQDVQCAANCQLDHVLLKLLKLAVAAVQMHPWAFFSSGSLQVHMSTCCSMMLQVAQTRTAAALRALAGCCMSFLTACSSSPAYTMREQLVELRMQGSERQQAKERWQHLSNEAKALLRGFWEVDQRCAQVVECIVGTYLPLTEAERAEWNADAETFFHSVEARNTDEEHRTAARNLLQDVVSMDVPMQAPMIVAAMKSVQALRAPADSMPDAAQASELNRKEGLYAAACALEGDLFDYLDVKEWLQVSLLPEITTATKCSQALQLTCMHCVASWIASVKREWRADVYAPLVSVLAAAQSDLCLRLTAVDTLRVMVDDWEFDEEVFLPFLQPVLAQLPSLLNTCHSAESYGLVFTLVTIVVERMGDQVAPHAETILSWLPRVWQQGDGVGLLRVQVLALLQRLMNALSLSSPLTYPFVLPIMDYSLAVHGPEALSLLEDALILWLVAVRNAPAGGLDLLQLWPHWLQLMRVSIEHVPLCMQVATSCILLGGVPFLQQQGSGIAQALEHIVPEMSSAALVTVYTPMMYLLQMYEADGLRLLEKPFSKVLERLASGEERGLCWAKGVCLVARAVLHCSQATMLLFESAAAAGMRFVRGGNALVTPLTDAPAQPAQQAGGHFLAAFIGECVDRFDTIAQPADRKLCAMAFLRALTLPMPDVLEHFELIMVCALSVHSALEGDSGANTPFDDIYYSMSDSRGDLEWKAWETMPALNASQDANGEFQRKTSLSESDLVKCMRLSTWAKQCLQEAEQVHGSALHNAAAAIPKALAEQVSSLVARAQSTGA